MNIRPLLLPALCLGGAAVLIAPSRPLSAFSKTGESLDETQRDVRLFDNFLDPSANDNTNSPAQFPGWNGAELAIWKAIVEWGSTLHGNGTGDPQGGNLLGSGGANFDAMWAGNASAIGGMNNNVVSALTTCGGGGTLAFTELPASNGWRIRFCDEWIWDDGPGSIVGSRFDIQSVMTHEYGHALGLGHSAVPSATMAPSGSPGQTQLRSIEADDIAGIQCVYGLASATKPVITATSADPVAGTLAIFGSNFDAIDNEVWFTNVLVTNPSVDPIVRMTGVPSTGGGTLITVAIPADASPGDVIVKAPGAGGSTISNAYPTDLVGVFGTPPGTHPDITSVTPSSIDALIPGTAQTITLTGTNFDLVTAIRLDLVPVPVSSYTIVDPTTITLDMPQASSLGVHSLVVQDALVSDSFAVTIVAPVTPRLQWGTGDPLNSVSGTSGLDMIVSGQPGALHVVRGSSVGPPSLWRFRGNPGNPLVDAGAYVIPAQGWLAVHIDGWNPSLTGSTWFGRSYAVAPGTSVASNDQTVMLVP